MAEPRWDREVDFLVAGAGVGGMAAALVAALEGLDVLVCEKSDQVGGTSATSAGTLWIPANNQSKAAGWSDTAEAAATYMTGLVGDGSGGEELRRAFLATGPRALDYFQSRTEVKFVAAGKHPDYRSNVAGAAVAGRAVVAEIFDGRRLGAEFRRVRPPIAEFMLLGGMMVSKDDIAHLIHRFDGLSHFLQAARLTLRYWADRLRHRRGTRLTMGNALVARLFFSLLQNKVPVWTGAAVETLHGNADGIAGAAIRRDDALVQVKARKGVLLATGGYGRNERYRAAFMPRPTPARSLASEHNTGDGLALGESVGARITPGQHRGGALWSPVSETRRRDGSRGLFPHLSLDRAKPGLIAVNAAGRRFVNEGASYHDFVEAMYRSHATANTMPAYLVCDATFIRRYGLGLIYPGTRNLAPHERSGYLTCAATLGELAGKLGVDAAELANTVARHNRFAATGVDLDFGKGDTELSRFNGDPAHRPNPCLGAIETPPFCALPVWPAEIAVSTGLDTDADGRVVAASGRAIPGLYACGNDMASIMRGTYPGPGTTLGPALVFGYRAAMHAAGKPA